MLWYVDGNNFEFTNYIFIKPNFRGHNLKAMNTLVFEISEEYIHIKIEIIDSFNQTRSQKYSCLRCPDTNPEYGISLKYDGFYYKC